MRVSYKLISILALLGFIAGWLFPVEGPIDYKYDEMVGNKTIKKPVVNAPLPKEEYKWDIDIPDIKEVLIDLNEDGEQEWYLFMPLKNK
jgi:hypothetical protein